MRKQAIAAWAVPSSRGTTTYEITLWDDYTTSCDDPSWISHKAPKTCKHIRELQPEILEAIEDHKAGTLAALQRTEPSVRQTKKVAKISIQPTPRRAMRLED